MLCGVGELGERLYLEPLVSVAAVDVVQAHLKLQCGVSLIQLRVNFGKWLGVLVGKLRLGVPAHDSGAIVCQHDHVALVIWIRRCAVVTTER